ncbi:MAG: putative colanic acid biosynthesis acetyltransferase [Candidatus Sumerlaeia bacterium]|nr:putative colanic acid biosynthesis acetyltransferase [Candidatus Sumerlaeia bacterium]
MKQKRLNTKSQSTAFVSPWTKRDRLLMGLWEVVRLLLFRPTPKPLYMWRAWLLKLFGAKIRGTVFVASSARIKIPWNLEMDHRACLGHDVNVYNLGRVRLGRACTVAQEVMLCGGTHDLTTRRLPLMTGDIDIMQDVFVGARALILPGVTLGEGSVVGAGAVVTSDVKSMAIVAGNPAKVIGERELHD